MTIGMFIAGVFAVVWVGSLVVIVVAAIKAPRRPDLDDEITGTVFVSNRLRERRHTHPRRAHRSGVGSPWR